MRVVYLSRDEESGQFLVTYRRDGDKNLTLFTRPFGEWRDAKGIDTDGRETPRYTRI